MPKTHLTRKNLIAISLVFFFGVMILLSALAIDGGNPFFAKNNPIQSLIRGMFPLETEEGLIVNGVPIGSIQAYILIVLFVIYLVVCSAAILYEYRLAKYYDEKPNSKKWMITYLVTFLVCGALWIGISMVSQISDKPFPFYIKTSFIFLGESILSGAILYLILGSFILAVCTLVVNLRDIDKPFRFFDSQKEAIKEQEKKELEEAVAKAQGELAASFGEASAKGGVAGASGAAGSASGLAEGVEPSPLKDKVRVFPGLCTIDDEFLAPTLREEDTDIPLDVICTRFRSYLAAHEKLYFSPRVIREFIAALAASRLIILEGLSGTGKSSLARYFSEFVSEKSFFEAVQATWRDRTSLLGYYNDFSKTYNETEFLKRLYRATYEKDALNVMVLDEVNISRVEYYFADFLSVLEYPEDEWKIKIMQFPYDFDAPTHLEDGVLKIPANTYFIGTANKDESTFTITDKVYDRAITIDFDDRNEAFVPEGDSDPITLSYPRLRALYDAAEADASLNLNATDKKRFKALTDFVYDTFDLTFGNRILRQIERFVPVYVACGGTKEEALDFLFARKVVAKLEGRFEEGVKQGLSDLRSLIRKTYGEGAFAETGHVIDRLARKL